MTSPTVVSTSLSTREYLVRIKSSPGNASNDERVISVRLFDDQDQASEEIILKNVESQDIDVFRVRTEQQLSDRIQRLKLHTSNVRQQRSEPKSNQRVFLKWIELTDLRTKRTFCFAVGDYLPSSLGDALELTEVHEDKPCDAKKRDDTIVRSSDRSQSTLRIRNLTQMDRNARRGISRTDVREENRNLYDVRTKTGHQGFFGIKSLLKANVYVQLYDVHQQSSEPILLKLSRLHEQPFRSNQTDQFEVSTRTKLDTLKKVEVWHDGEKGTRFHCDTLEITDRSNGQMYCFRIEGKLLTTCFARRRGVAI
jgi:hypothetical protein